MVRTANCRGIVSRTLCLISVLLMPLLLLSVGDASVFTGLLANGIQFILIAAILAR